MRDRATCPLSRYIPLAPALIFFVSLGASANAAPLQFQDRGAFNAAAHPQGIPFGATAGDCVINPSNFTCNYTFDNLLFVSYDLAGIGLLGDSLGLGFFAGQGAFHHFLAPVVGIGFDLVSVSLPSLGGSGGSSGPSEFSFAGTVFSLPPMPPGSPLFFGAIFDTPQLSIPASVTSAPPTLPGGFVIQNLSVTVVPEPATLWLLGTAASVVVGSRRFFSRRRTPRP